MTYSHPNGGGPFADLLPTETELAIVDEVLAEVAVEDPGGSWDPPDDGDEGPWDDQAQLAYDLDAASALELAGIDPLEYDDLMRCASTLELARQSEDEQDAERAAGPRHRRYSAEERLSRALSRIETGTFTPGLPYRDQADLSNTSAPYGCGELYDEFGRCSSAYQALRS
jgi:hypothetical protein